MGIMDAFKPEDRTEITYSNFYNLIKQAAKYEIVMNAVNCDVPHGYIRETMTGKSSKESWTKRSKRTSDRMHWKRYRRIIYRQAQKNRFTGQENARLKKRRGREKRVMVKMNLKFRDFLTLLSPAQHITVQDEDNPLKQGESDTLFKGKAAKARREEVLADREVKMIAQTGDPDLPGTYVFKIWLYK